MVWCRVWPRWQRVQPAMSIKKEKERKTTSLKINREVENWNICRRHSWEHFVTVPPPPPLLLLLPLLPLLPPPSPPPVITLFIGARWSRDGRTRRHWPAPTPLFPLVFLDSSSCFCRAWSAPSWFYLSCTTDLLPFDFSCFLFFPLFSWRGLTFGFIYWFISDSFLELTAMSPELMGWFHATASFRNFPAPMNQFFR